MTSAEELRALVVDDSGPFVEQTAKRLSADHDVDATSATGVEDALAVLDGSAVDCVVASATLPGTDAAAFLAAVRDRVEDLPVVFLTGRGDELPVDDVASGAVDYLYRFEIAEDGRYERLAGRIRSAVDRRRTRRELTRRTERLEEFASVVSHDLRNPLNVAQSSLVLLRGDADSEHLDRIDRSLSRMNDIIADALLLVRESDAVENPSPVDLETMVQDAWSAVDPGETELTVEVTGRIEADADLLREALENLFENALAHGGATTVTVGPLGGDAGDFYVADDGEGIDADRRDEVFETGYTTARAGTGLGLSIVREIANAHGWTVTATESADGGARFEVTGVAGR